MNTQSIIEKVACKYISNFQNILLSYIYRIRAIYFAHYCKHISSLLYCIYIILKWVINTKYFLFGKIYNYCENDIPIIQVKNF